MPQQSSREPAQRRSGATSSTGSAPTQPGSSDGSRNAPTSQSGLSGQLPAITVPKGGGAIRGMGEKFDVNPVTGTGALSVPIATSPGRAGFDPELSLSYDSGAGNGPFGFGWSLSLPSITRKTDKGLPRYLDDEESDIFILSGAEDLMPLLNKVDGQWTPESVPNRVVGEGEDEREYRITRYRPRIEGLFARIERWTNQSDPGDICWRAITKGNITTWYGKSSQSRIVDPADPSRIFSWLICESYDDKGNAIVYEYKAEDSTDVKLAPHEKNRTDLCRAANRYLKRIKYGNTTPNRDADWNATDPTLLTDWLFEVVCDYGEHKLDAPAPNDDTSTSQDSSWDCRPDPFSSYRSGFEVRTYRLCQRVLMFHHFPNEAGVGENCLVRSTDFAYRYEEEPDDPHNLIYSFLLAVTQSGYKRQGDGYLKRSLPPLEFTYSQTPTEAELNAQAVETVDAERLQNLPIGFDGSTYQWVDLDGEGIPGILTEQASAWYYKPNLGDARFGPLEMVASMPSLAALNGGGQQLLDLAGDGQLDLAEFGGPTPGFYERTHDEDWITFRTFESLPVIDWSDPNLRFVDLTGDGHADILITEDRVIVWHLSLAEAGFDRAERVQQALDEEQGPHLIFADGTQSIFLTDMSGDGLVDLARIRNGEVCYWPNLGYGRFGPKVTMDDSPWFDRPDLFDQQRIRLADIDGSGTTDIVYLGRSTIDLYHNQSGNGWSEAQQLHHFPRIDNLAAVSVTDLTGNGTACLVWSSPLPGDRRQPVRYIDLMGGKKPHLMVASKNNLGAETHVHYVSSIKFYLADKAAGRPWITKLPFPVHVVERTETHDRISRNRFLTRYAYHHGYFDSIEREFRGFGMVEQWDTDEYASFEASGVLEGTTNWDAASHVPPVLTRSWFHTGAYLQGDTISRHYASEYYREGDASLGEAGLGEEKMEALLLPDTLLPDGQTIEEERQACRALKGSLLRQEIYGLDGSEEADRPYSVSERNYTVRRLQPEGPNRHVVFFTHDRESIDFHYERELYEINKTSGELAGPNTPVAQMALVADPRISHVMTLEVDDFGNVRKAVSIGYGRRYKFNDPDLDADTIDKVRSEQQQSRLTYTENEYTNLIDQDHDYRTPLPCEARTYELTGFTPEDNAHRFSYDEWTADEFALLASVTEIPYEQCADQNLQQKRLIEHARSRYRRDDLSEFCAPGELETLALPGESYLLAFTPGLITDVYGVDRVTDDMLVEGGWVQFDGDAHWWDPAGRVYFHHNPEADANQELSEARTHFFLPRRATDPFGNHTTIDYAYDLLPARTVDAVGNTVTTENDYRVLQSTTVTDPNGNRSEVSFDALGLVAGTAVMGKVGEQLGDSLDVFDADLTQAERDAFFADPKGQAAALLGTATTRIVYDLDRYAATQRANPEEPDRWQPVYAATLARERHVNDLKPGETSPIQVSFSYSDGFGREVQSKVQAEPGPLEEGGPDIDPRWVGSGWTIFNNKGKPVRQYEPFFSATHAFEFAREEGVSPILFYDPLERVAATLHPNHTYEKVVFDPWRQATWDVNDTVLMDPEQDGDVSDFFSNLDIDEYRPTWFERRVVGSLGSHEQAAANRSAVHADTPTVTILDALGRPFLSIEHNRFQREDRSTGNIEIVEERYTTCTELDIEGNPRAIIDARGNTVMLYKYNMIGPDEDEDGEDAAGADDDEDEEEGSDSHQVYQNSMDGGERWTLFDVADNPIYAWDSRGHCFRSIYDELRRPTLVYVCGTDPQQPEQEILYEATVYGEGHPAAEALNLRGQVFQQYDGAGIAGSVGSGLQPGTEAAFDFKGNPLFSTRQLAQEYKDTVNWLPLKPHVTLAPNSQLNLAALQQATTFMLEAEIFTTGVTYDALNRPVTQSTPDGSATRHRYNEANLLEHVEANVRGATTATIYVQNIDYDAKGQRTRIEYGNRVTTTYAYDAETFRLTNLHTERATGSNPLQDLSYTYDPTGNISHIQDDAQQTIFFRNQVVRPHSDYEYDALYRLIKATGREHLGQNPSGVLNPPVRPSHTDVPRTGLDHPSNGEAMGNYTQWYAYDDVGNILEMRHHTASGGWRRCYQYAMDSNRLLSTSGPGELQGANDTCQTPEAAVPVYKEHYSYDDHGNMITMPHLPMMRWDSEDQLQATAQQVNNHGGIPELTYYVYDTGGERVRKVTERSLSAQDVATGNTPTRMKQRIYLDGFEIYLEYNGNDEELELRRETLHIMDDEKRIALVETKTHDDGLPIPIPSPSTRYQLGNHLDSASLELDGNGDIISYEEYHTYGAAAYQAVRSGVGVGLKRYRYTGKERDEETGLYYQSARYYSSWLGRWISTDPGDLIDGINMYRYASNNPLIVIDSDGKSGVIASLLRLGVIHLWSKAAREYKKLARAKREFRALLRKAHEHQRSWIPPKRKWTIGYCHGTAKYTTGRISGSVNMRFKQAYATAIRLRIPRGPLFLIGTNASKQFNKPGGTQDQISRARGQRRTNTKYKVRPKSVGFREAYEVLQSGAPVTFLINKRSHWVTVVKQPGTKHIWVLDSWYKSGKGVKRLPVGSLDKLRQNQAVHYPLAGSQHTLQPTFGYWFKRDPRGPNNKSPEKSRAVPADWARLRRKYNIRPQGSP